MRILHKGIVLVAVPLALQIVVIAALAFLLYQTDREQEREAERCRLSMIGSRLLFANCDAGNILIRAFRLQNIRILDNFFDECDYIDRLNKEMSVIPADDAVEGRELQLKCLKAQNAVTVRMRQIGELATGGFGMGTLRSVLESYRKLIRELDEVFGLLRLRHQALDSGLPEKWHRLDVLHQQMNEVLLYASAATALMAIFLIWYYRNEFLLRISKVSQNVQSLTLGHQAAIVVKGADEIADFNAAFQRMSAQLAAVAERERALFENSSDMICVLDEKLNFSRVNKAAARLCKLDSDELLQKPVHFILLADENEISKIEHLLISARTTGSASTFESQLKSPEGKPISTLWSAFWSPDKKYCHCVIHDISEERKLDKMRQSFLKLIAADFSKPLNHIAELVERLSSGSSGDLPENATKKIAGATSTLGRMVSMVDELIQLETLKSSSLNLVKQKIPVVDVLSETVKDTESSAEKRQIKLQIECDPSLNFYVDSDRIVRVLMNFVSNAIKFSPEGSTVIIRASEDIAKITISVIDNGRGIPREALSKLFQAFQQVETADGKRGKGTGLGLVVCKKIIEEHEGQIGVESEEGKGSRFWIQIPKHSDAGVIPTDVAESTSGWISPQQNKTDDSTQAPIANDTTDDGSRNYPAVPASTQITHQPTTLTTEKTQLSSKNATKFNFWERLSFKQKGMLLVGLPILFQGIFMVAMLYLFNESAQSFAKQMHNRFVCRNAIRTATPFFQLMVSLRTEGQAGTGLHTCREVIAEERERVVAFGKSVENDKMAQEYYTRISRYLKNTLLPITTRLSEDLTEGRGQLDESENRRYANVLIGMINGLCLHVQDLVKACDFRDKNTPVRLKELRQFEVTALAIALVCNVTAAAWLTIFFSSDVVRRFLLLSDNSQRLAKGSPLNATLTGTDEIAHLDKAFHVMAERLASARATESTFLDNANNIICSLDSQGRFLSLNKAAAEKLSIPYEKIADYSFSSLIQESERQNFEKLLERSRESSTPDSIELRVKSGEQLMDTVWSFIWSNVEQEYYAVGYDITATRDLDRMKKEFLALVTHDLRTPLTTIQGMAIILETGKLGELPPAAAVQISEIKNESKQILELVNDLLDLSKLEAGELKADANEFSFTQLLDKIEDSLEADEIQIRLAESPSETLNLLLEADAERLAYAISGIIGELFPHNSAIKLTLQQKQNADRESTLNLTFIGHSDASADTVDSINDKELSRYSETSTHRLRLPLSKRILQNHKASARAKFLSHDSENMILEFELITASTKTPRRSELA